MSDAKNAEVKTKVYLLGVEQRGLLMIEERINKLRPVELRCFFSLKDFLKSAMESPPDLVALSMNFKHPNTVQFPVIFTQAIQKPVIVFLEKEDNRTRTMMTAAESEFKITGTITAHNLWMKICHCLESQAEKAAREARDRNFAEGDGSDGAILLKGEKPADQQNDMMASLGYLLKDLERGEAGEASAGPGASYHEGQERLELPTVMQEGTGSHGHQTSESAGAVGKAHQANQQGQPSSQETAQADSDTKGRSEKTAKSPSDSAVPLRPEAGNSQSAAKPAKKSTKKPSLAEQMQAAKKPKTSIGTGASKKKATEAKVSEESPSGGKRQQNAPIDTSGGGHGKTPQAPIQVGGRLDEKVKKILLQSSQEAIPEQITLVFQSEEEAASGLPIVQVKMDHQQGFLVIRSKPPGPISTEWFSQFRDGLLSKLKDAGFEAFITPYMAQLQEQLVAKMEAIDEFADQQQREDMEFKFASHKYVEPDLQKAIDSGMLEVEPDMIRPNKTVYFDVFIYLPRNKRTVRYLKKGGAMSEEQANRLETQPGGKKLYVNPQDEHQLRRFLLEVSVEDHLKEDKETSSAQPEDKVSDDPSDEGQGNAA